MSERGFALLELLVASAAGVIVLLGVGAFYLATVRFGNEGTAQIALQRQASMVIDEAARQIAPATLLEHPVACGGDANGLRATNSCGTFCFHRESATGSQLLEDRTLVATGSENIECPNQTASTGTNINLLSGALIPAGGSAGLLSTVGTACGASTGGFCPSLVRHDGTTCVVGTALKFRLRVQLPGTSSYQTMTFSTTIAGRTLPVPISPALTCP